MDAKKLANLEAAVVEAALALYRLVKHGGTGAEMFARIGAVIDAAETLSLYWIAGGGAAMSGGGVAEIKAHYEALGDTPAPCATDAVLADVLRLVAEVERLRKNLMTHESLVMLCRDVTSQMDGLMRALRDAVADVDEADDE